MADNQKDNTAAAAHDHPSAPGPAHGHHHGHDHGHFAAANEEFFDKMAKEYNERPQVQQLARKVVDSMRQTYPALFNEETTTLLDFACGPGKMHISM